VAEAVLGAVGKESLVMAICLRGREMACDLLVLLVHVGYVMSLFGGRLLVGVDIQKGRISWVDWLGWFGDVTGLPACRLGHCL
jgi:hypothetical protein